MSFNFNMKNLDDVDTLGPKLSHGWVSGDFRALEGSMVSGMSRETAC